MGLYSELRTRKAYGTALLGQQQRIAEAIRSSADLHDEEEILGLLHEAEEEVQQEIDTERELRTQVKNGALTRMTTPFPARSSALKACQSTHADLRRLPFR
jgi:hypothetical protein